MTLKSFFKDLGRRQNKNRELVFTVVKDRSEVKGVSQDSRLSSFGNIKIGINLSANELYDIYIKCNAVRTAIDTIACIAVGTPFVANDTIRSFLSKVNSNGEDYSSLFYKCFVDLLVYDIAFIEIVRNTKGQVLELYNRDPNTFRVERDEHGVITKICQVLMSKTVEFGEDEIEMMVLHPSTKHPFGVPIIESIAGEAATIMLLQDSAAHETDPGSVPPGILNLGRLGDEEYKRAKEVIKEAFLSSSPTKVAIVRNLTNIEWIPLKTATQVTSAYATIIDQCNNVIASAFNVPVTLISRYTPTRSFEVQQEMMHNRFVHLLHRLMEKFINRKVAPGLGVEGDFHFVDQRLDVNNIKSLVESGIVSVDEVRALLGLPPKGAANETE